VRPDEKIEDTAYRIFFPYAVAASSRIESDNVDFVHYTSASNALRIIDSKTVTLRNAALMNDFSEIDYGEKCLQRAWNSEHGRGPSPDEHGRLLTLLNDIDPELIDKIASHYDRDLISRRTNTFILSLAEHDDLTEGVYGRLSMWRAYGGRTNVAIVLDRAPMLRPADGHAGFTSPVLYSDMDKFPLHFRQVIDNIERHIDFVRTMKSDEIYGSLVGAFNAAAISTKHPGFSEEREWRIIYAPWLASSDTVSDAIIDIGGVPQRVQQIKLADRPEAGLTGIEIPQLFKKIIVGPTESPSILVDAFVEKLTAAGVSDARDRVVVSNIPIRR
jgi:hypothetical protein